MSDKNRERSLFCLVGGIVPVICLFAVLFSQSSIAFAQSQDISMPSPVHANELRGSIDARDLGDSRSTDHYYAFHGNPGDFVIVVESTNLNGDIDIFTAGSLRPLLKVTIYAESTTTTTKSIYLQQREALILRVEARSPNDNAGTYRISFGGTFEPVAGTPLVASADVETTTGSTPPTKKGRRVSSVGARIEEPPAPVEPPPVPQPTPVEPEPETAKTVAPIPPDKPEVSESSSTSKRSSKTRPPRHRARQSAEASKTETPIAKEETSKEKLKEEPIKEEPTTATSHEEPKKPEVVENKAEPTVEPSTSGGETPKPSAPTVKVLGPRLIIQTKDGKSIERYMSSVKRVTVERGQIVVVGTDGKIERILMADVERMSIGP